MTHLAAILVITLATGCSKPAGDCGALGPTFDRLNQGELDRAKLSPGEDPIKARQKGALVLDRMKGAMISSCTKTTWSAEVVDCMITASTSAALAQCQQLLTADQRTEAQRAVADVVREVGGTLRPTTPP